MSRRTQKGEKDTVTRLWELVKQGKVFSFYVPEPNKWEIFLTEDDYKNAGSLERKESERVYLTKAEVRARFQMDDAPGSP